MSVSPEVRDVLLGAADVIERGGWCQGAYERSGSFCVSGAIRKASGWKADGHLTTICVDAHGALWQALGENMADWNDAPGRTQAEVVAKLREVAAS